MILKVKKTTGALIINGIGGDKILSFFVNVRTRRLHVIVAIFELNVRVFVVKFLIRDSANVFLEVLREVLTQK